MKIVLFGGSNTARGMCIYAGARKYTENNGGELLSYASFGASSLQNYIELLNNEENVKDADLIISQTSMNDFHHNIASRYQLPLEMLFKEMCVYYSKLYELRKKVLVLIVNRTHKAEKHTYVSNMHRFFADMFGFNVIDLERHYKAELYSTIYNKYQTETFSKDPSHEFRGILYHLVYRAIENFDKLMMPKENVEHKKYHNNFYLYNAESLPNRLEKVSYQAHETVYEDKVINIDNDEVSIDVPYGYTIKAYSTSCIMNKGVSEKSVANCFFNSIKLQSGDAILVKYNRFGRMFEYILSDDFKNKVLTNNLPLRIKTNLENLPLNERSFFEILNNKATSDTKNSTLYLGTVLFVRDEKEIAVEEYEKFKQLENKPDEFFKPKYKLSDPYEGYSILHNRFIQIDKKYDANYLIPDLTILMSLFAPKSFEFLQQADVAEYVEKLKKEAKEESNSSIDNKQVSSAVTVKKEIAPENAQLLKKTLKKIYTHVTNDEYKDFENNNFIRGKFSLINSKIIIEGKNVEVYLSNVTLKNTVIHMRNNNSVLVAYDTVLANINPLLLSESVCCVIGSNLSSGPTEIRVGLENLYIGDDCMFAKRIYIQNHDGHSIYDIDSLKLCSQSNPIIIGQHVWLGYNTTLLKGSIIGSGSLVGACSTVNHSFKSNSVLAGTPAKAIKDNALWLRQGLHVVEEEKRDKYAVIEGNEKNKFVFKNDTYVNGVMELDKNLKIKKTAKERLDLIIKYFGLPEL